MCFPDYVITTILTTRGINAEESKADRRFRIIRLAKERNKKQTQVSQFNTAANTEKVSLSPDLQAGLCVRDGHCLTRNSCQSETINRFPLIY